MNFYGKRIKMEMIKKKIKDNNLSISHFTKKKVYRIDPTLFRKSVEESNSFRELKDKLKTYLTNDELRNRINKDNLSIEHFGKNKQNKKYTTEDMFKK